MGSNILGIGASGLNAAQMGLATTGHNIANAATPGYHRQQTIQGSNIPQAIGVGFLGQGVSVTTVRRVYSQFVENQVVQAQAQSSELDANYSQLKQIDNMLADPSSGMSPALQDFFNGVQGVASSPANVPSRQAMLSSAESLVARFHAMDQRLTDLRDGVNSQLTSSVELINTYAKQIAQLNDAIGKAEANANGQPANDLRDQRDALITELNKEVKATVVRQGDSDYNVFIGNGQSLVVGSQTFSLATKPSPTDVSRLEVNYVTAGGNTVLDENALAGGKLAGVLRFRTDSLEPARDALGRVAIGLAGTFNDQHSLGQDLNGAIGGSLFKMATPQVAASTKNTGTAVISASFSNYSALTTSDYKLRYDGTNYTLTRLSDNVNQVFTFAAFPATVDGVTLSLTAGAVAGDEFSIRPTVNGARDIAVAFSDPAKIAAAAPIRTAYPLTNSGTGRISAGTVNTPPPVNANLTQPVTITFTSATTFDVTGTGTGNPTGVAYTAGGNISYNGWTVQISGTPATGATFSVGPNTSGVADGRNALLLGALKTTNTLANGTASYQGAYGQLVSSVGNKTRELEVTSTAQASLLKQTLDAQQSESGVNLDEEAANLLRYQQAYQASGKIMAISSQLFEVLLSLGGR